MGSVKGMVPLSKPVLSPEVSERKFSGQGTWTHGKDFKLPLPSRKIRGFTEGRNTYLDGGFVQDLATGSVKNQGEDDNGARGNGGLMGCRSGNKGSAAFDKEPPPNPAQLAATLGFSR